MAASLLIRMEVQEDRISELGMLAVQRQIETLQGHLDSVCRSTEDSIEEAAIAGSGALGALQAQHSSFVSNAQQVPTSPCQGITALVKT